jgi:hypothetical protein
MVVKDDLKDLLENGIVLEIFTVDQAIFTNQLILDHNKKLIDLRVNNIFGFFQSSVIDKIILSLSKIYEKPNPRYEIRSIPVALEVINKNIENLDITNVYQFKMKLPYFEIDDKQISSISTKDLLKLFLEKIQDKISNSNTIDGYSFNKNYEPIKTLRDKVISHREKINISDIDLPTWQGIKELLLLAKKIVGIIGISFLNIAYESDEGKYLLEDDAKRIEIQFNQMLKKIFLEI